jgi:hypothetical protein
VPKLSSLLVMGLLAGGCATEEEVLFGEPGRVTGGFEGVTVTGGSSCQVNGACTVSWRQQIYPQVLDGPPGSCGAFGCHRDGAGNFIFSADPDEAYDSLLAFDLPAGRSYVVPCEPSLSHIMCNLRFEAGVDNPYVGPDAEFTGGCGSSMPKVDATVDSAPLAQEDLDLLAEWILCGAPKN